MGFKKGPADAPYFQKMTNAITQTDRLDAEPSDTRFNDEMQLSWKRNVTPGA